MAGLVESIEDESEAEATQSTEMDGYAPAGDGPVSHLDSFFAGSAWTREDVMLLLMALQAAVLLVWINAEVR
jgi:hypothetical protein